MNVHVIKSQITLQQPFSGLHDDFLGQVVEHISTAAPVMIQHHFYSDRISKQIKQKEIE